MPTFPKPWTATVAPFRLSFTFDAASRVAYMRPRDVASSRPRDPPITSGLPVTTPGCAKPLFIEIVSMIHAIVWLSVYTSGADVLLGADDDRDLGRIPPGQSLARSL